MKDITTWLADVDPGAPPILWIWGVPGVGKSTIAQTVAQKEDKRGHLGASFFFSHDTTEGRDPLLLIRTLAVKLSGFNDVYKAHLAKELQRNPGAGEGEYEEQLEALLVKPLSACKSLPFPILIVIDALDECDPESARAGIIKAFSVGIPKIRQKVKILITSRPQLPKTHAESQEPPLRKISRSLELRQTYDAVHEGDINNAGLEGDISNAVPRRDIARYLDHHFQRIANKSRDPMDKLPVPWPSGAEKAILLKQTGTLFIVASTLINFIDHDSLSPQVQLDKLTKRNVTVALRSKDPLILMYTTVIDRALQDESEDSDVLDLARRVVGCIVLAEDPMAKDTLAAFLAEPNISGALARFRSLFIIPTASDTPIRVLHRSLREYLTNPTHCDSRMHIDPTSGHIKLAKHCITHLASWRRDPGVINGTGITRLGKKRGPLKEGPGNDISAHLRYSCLYVIAHFTACSPNTASLQPALTEFCESRLLAWIDVLGCRSQIGVALGALRALHVWYSVRSGSSVSLFTINSSNTSTPYRKLPTTPRTSSRSLRMHGACLTDFLTSLVRMLDNSTSLHYHGHLRQPCGPSMISRSFIFHATRKAITL